MRTTKLLLAASKATVVGLAAAVVGVGLAASASAAPPKCSELEGFVDASQICQIQATDPAYTLNIAYPVLFPDQQPVFDYIKQTRDGFLNVAKMPDSRAMPYELETTTTEYNSAVPPRGTQTVVFKTFQDVGGAHPQTYYKTFNWDQGMRKPIQVDTGGSDKIQPLFQPGTDPWSVIFPLVKTELERQSGHPVALGPAAGLDPTRYQNFALTNDTLVFFFSQGEFLPESAGALQVTIPRAAVDRMIA
jgi:hypothetical protein